MSQSYERCLPEFSTQFLNDFLSWPPLITVFHVVDGHANFGYILDVLFWGTVLKFPDVNQVVERVRIVDLIDRETTEGDKFIFVNCRGLILRKLPYWCKFPLRAFVGSKR